jgi:hypothetical protein
MRPAFLAAVLGGFDRYIATTGNDGNPGTAAAPWLTTAPLKTAGAALGAGQRLTAYIAPGTYAGQNIELQFTGVGAYLGVTLAPGVIFDFGGGDSSCFNAGGVAGTLEIIGNSAERAIVRGFSVGDGNGVGAFAQATIRVSNLIVEDCVDGASAHDSSSLYSSNCLYRNNSKSPFAHINTSGTVRHENDVFEASASSLLGLGAVQENNAVPPQFINCVLEPFAAGQALGLQSGLFQNCRIGALDKRVILGNRNTGLASNVVIEDSYVHVRAECLDSFTLIRCFGRYSARLSNNGTTGNVLENCVFVGPAISGSPTSALMAEYDPGSQTDWSATDTVFTGYGTALGGGFNSTLAAYAVAAGNFARNCCLFGNSTNVDASLTAAGFDITGTVTANPLLGDADSYVQADYAVGAGSPCIGAGTGGGNIGFTLADIA